jgi:hypothetical protein
MVSDIDLAGYLRGLFDSDARRNRPDVSDWRLDPRFNASSVLPLPSRAAHDQALLAPFLSTEQASVTVVPSPDGSARHPYLLDFMQAVSSVSVEQFQADLYWTSRWTSERHLNPLVASLLDSASRGVETKVLLDSSWFNSGRNMQVVNCLRENVTSGQPMVSRLLDGRSPITLLHNKGTVIDGRISAITSNNWVSASFSRNRELAVVVESQEVASYFLKAFDFDWLPDETPPECDAGPDLELLLGRSVVFDASSCSEDRLIAEYCWDIDADGIVDSRDDRVLFKGTVPGQHVVVLKVTDAWGNSAVDEIRVTVVSPTPVGDENSAIVPPRTLWLLPALIAAGALVARMARRRKRGRDPRNLNHRARS